MSSPLPKSLPHAELYVLLALSRSELHAYAVNSTIISSSMGAVALSAGSVYPLLRTMTKAGLITDTGYRPAGKSGKEWLHYTITSEGRLRAKEELIRLRHTVKIGENLGYFDGETPPEIQRILDQLKS